jgi:peptidoglycan hydrolase FlgJ
MAPVIPIAAETKAVSDTDMEQKRLRTACEEFEAILLQYLLKSMRQAVVRADQPGQAQEVYESMLDQQLAMEMSRNQSNGLAAMLYQQLLPSLQGSSSDDSSLNNSLKKK